MVNFTLVSVGDFFMRYWLGWFGISIWGGWLQIFSPIFLSALSDAVFFLAGMVVTSVLVFSSLSFFHCLFWFFCGLFLWQVWSLNFGLLLAATLGWLVTVGTTVWRLPKNQLRAYWWLVSVCANAEFAIISPTSPITSSPVVLLTW